MELRYDHLFVWMGWAKEPMQAIFSPAYRIVSEDDGMMSFQKACDDLGNLIPYRCQCEGVEMVVAVENADADNMTMAEPVRLALAEVLLQPVLKMLSFVLGKKVSLLDRQAEMPQNMVAFTLTKDGSAVSSGAICLEVKELKEALLNSKWLDEQALGDTAYDFFPEVMMSLEHVDAASGEYLLMPELTDTEDKEYPAVLRSQGCDGFFQAMVNFAQKKITLTGFSTHLEENEIPLDKCMSFPDCIASVTLAQLHQLDKDRKNVVLELPEIRQVDYGKLSGQLVRVGQMTALAVK